jgi:DNA polymerase/3'-5' exonuclease PolX
VIIVCGGSYRRGKASCGDMDIVITHPDGERYTSKHMQKLLASKCTDFELENHVIILYSSFRRILFSVYAIIFY